MWIWDLQITGSVHTVPPMTGMAGWVLHLLLIAGFLNLGSIDTSEWIILCCGWLSCALFSVEQHLWPLPTRCQLYCPLPCDTPKYLQTLLHVLGGEERDNPLSCQSLLWEPTVLSDWVLKLSKGWSYLIAFVNQLEVGPGVVPKINSNLCWENTIFE